MHDNSGKWPLVSNNDLVTVECQSAPLLAPRLNARCEVLAVKPQHTPTDELTNALYFRLSSIASFNIGTVYRPGGNRRHSVNVVHWMRSPFNATGT
jgi:hypothetical protein